MNRNLLIKVGTSILLILLFFLQISNKVFALNEVIETHIGNELTTEDGFKYEVNEEEKTAKILKYNGTAIEVTIPSKIGEYNVVEIGEGAFKDCKNIIKVAFSEGISIIGDYIFRNCYKLETVELPASLIKLGECVFTDCKSLKEIKINSANDKFKLVDGVLYNMDKTKIICYPAQREGTEYIIPETVKEIGGATFGYCQKLINIEVPNSVSKIGPYAFIFCDKITNINIPDGVTELSEYLLYGCSNLKSITIPESVTSIDRYSFYGCREIKEVYIPKNVSSISSYAFELSGIEKIDVDNDNQYFASVDEVLYNKEKTVLLRFPLRKEKEKYTVLSTVTTIGENAFMHCLYVKEIVLPDGLTEIKNSAFFECSGLEKINLPQGITAIPTYAFLSCKSLKSIDIPEGVTYIGNWAFSGCKNLKSIKIPTSMTKIGEKSFSNCINLRYIEIPDGVTDFGKDVFRNTERIKIICSEDSNAANYAEENKIKHAEILKGDINKDFKITATDLLKMKRMIVGLIEMTPEDKQILDMNDSGDVTATDILVLKQIIVDLVW